ncbi:acetyl/propionyl/methylcrotonyl-CoA carboxylase subunit alpha [Herbidospora yilanensis]|uniref:acetyl/propionyl/methylcrotonyl-CoA carboxylase subunit alpha n=1 Tax=Herbidospora yilanensis TaxID=354426 RepID=UPI000781246D|nr:biotin carboxylase N-terminal domain-containing protein [Herbidospora yilanensis]
MFDTVLVANRGEIALRVIKTLRRLGIRSVAVHTEGDTTHADEADVAVKIGSYLDASEVVEAARITGAQAIHPGYGFLSENTNFAAACHDNGIVFVGPPAGAIEAMGDKIRAKETVAAAGVPVVPGASTDLADFAEFPALIKPSAGGGGKGMVLVRAKEELPEALASAARTALAAFGDGTLLIERYVESPRHIEIQVLADAHGNVIHLGERECSLQRRHQKIVEEAPSPLLDEATRAKMGAAAVEAARSVGYVNAGTIEFIVHGTTGEFFFMEMNTRLQVEHPVTELVTGLDLVELQLRVAAGEELPLTQDDVRLDGHAVEARVYAEDPARGFLPSTGRVLKLTEPKVRFDSGIAEGGVVGTGYDPMLAKVIAWAPTRDEALATLDNALRETVILGVTTNLGFLQKLLRNDRVRRGVLDTGLVEREVDPAEPEIPGHVLAEAARLFAPVAASDDPWDIPDGWRLGRHRPPAHLLEVGGEIVEAPEDDGVTRRFTTARDGATLWLHSEGRTYKVARHEPIEERSAAAQAGDGAVRSPMPGTVLVVKAAQGDRVAEGQPLLIVEAMKMEHTVTAPVGGTVTLRVRAGQQVALDEVLAVVEAAL